MLANFTRNLTSLFGYQCLNLTQNVKLSIFREIYYADS